MNNFFTLVGFEYKKIFQSKMNITILSAILALSILLVFLNAFGGSYYHSIGSDISKTEALKMDKEAINKNKGYVTDEIIKKSIVVAQEGFNDKDNYFYNSYGEEVLKPNSQTEFILPYKNIYTFLNNIYSKQLTITDGTEPIQHLNPSEINGFYKSYKQLLADNVNMNNNMTQNEKEKHMDMISKIQTPFYNEYADGWLSIRNLLPLLGMLILTSIAIVIGNIFGKEYSRKTDAIILSAKVGKTKFLLAKIITAISFSVFSCLIISSFYVGTYLLTHGLDGFNVPLQFLSGFEYSTYPITISEFIAICLVVFLAVSIAFSCFCAMISSILKNSITALSILFLTIFMPMFIPPIDDRVIT